MRRTLTAFIFVAFPLALALAVARPGVAQQASAESPAVALLWMYAGKNADSRREQIRGWNHPRLEIVEADAVTGELAPGDFLFADEVLAAGKAHATARAGQTGALLLVASRAVAHELLLSVPPLLEILAG